MRSLGLSIWLPFTFVCVMVVLAILLFATGYLTQPMATILASAIVPTLGFVGYRYQKYLERGASALDAKRAEYSVFIHLAHDYVRGVIRNEDVGMWALSKQADVIYLVGSKDVAEAVSYFMLPAKYFGRLEAGKDSDIFDDMREGFEAALAKVVNTMRVDLTKDTSFVRPKQDDFTKSESRTQTRPLDVTKENNQ